MGSAGEMSSKYLGGQCPPSKVHTLAYTSSAPAFCQSAFPVSLTIRVESIVNKKGSYPLWNNLLQQAFTLAADIAL
jgi:hypothetical protein